MYDSFEIAKLIKKKFEGVITPEELMLLEKWTGLSEENARLLERLESGDELCDDIALWLSLKKDHLGNIEEDWITRLESATLKKIHQSSGDAENEDLRNPPNNEDETLEFRKKIRFLSLLPYVASLLFIFFGWYFIKQKPVQQKAVVLYDLTPGTTTASLTLSNGRVVELDKKKGRVIAGEKLVYDDGSSVLDAAATENTEYVLQTPKGGSYQLTLSDGTNIWLNADARLTYPLKFNQKERIVTLEGEAYFDVATFEKDKHKVPFIVETKKQRIEVLGTEFNVMAYKQESSEKTTLIEGSVKIRSRDRETVLEPGEQAVLNEDYLNKRKVQPEQYTAWRNNEFVFNDTELKEAMNMLGRWYDFETVYQDQPASSHFYGRISRKKGLAEVLKVLEAGGLKFRIEKNGDMNHVVVLK